MEGRDGARGKREEADEVICCAMTHLIWYQMNAY